jgi:serine/threonine protein kinase
MSSVQDIRRGLVESQLLTPDAVDEHVAQWRQQTGAAADAPAEPLIAWLVEKELLTEFQGAALLAGHFGPFMLGPYRVSEQIHASRSGGIFRAQHVEFNQPVSLKVFPSSLSDDPEMLARMGREVRICVALEHPNVVRSFQVGKLGNVYYLALEELIGETLKTKLDREGPLPYAVACRLIRDVAQGLGHLHENEVVHRDIRPANIWVTQSGSPKLMEFGAAVDALAFLDNLEEHEDEDIDIGEVVIGKYDYMPPEQAYDARCADAVSDIYALGSTLYHCLTGRPPFMHKDPVKQVLQHVYDLPQPPSELVDGIPHQLDETVAGMLAKDSNERFQKVRDVIFALNQFIGEEAQEEKVVVVDVSPGYLNWVGAAHPTAHKTLTEEAVGVTPELTSFLDFMAVRSARKQKRR